MDPNQIDDKRNNFSEVNDETDMWYMMQVYEYDWRLQEKQNRPRITRNPINRDREDAEIRLMGDYFDDPCKYPLYYFRRRYRMSRCFLDIVKGIESCEVDPLPKHFHFFTHRPDATGRMSMCAIMKCTSAIRQLTYGNTPDAFDEYLQMGKHTARDCLDNFNKCIIDLYMSKYLRKPTLKDVEKIYEVDENIHNFSAGENNDINVLDNSSLFEDLLNDIAHVAPYVVNGLGFEKGMAFDDWNDMYANPERNMQCNWIERCDVQRCKAKEIRDKEVHRRL
uniref:Putative nuclease HARBI1 n=1 Tax=Tanacetum cinerariifolium TaxID=118510 RepID=A0A699IHE5_TANCI|nr:putative nuclease HARBI1 [Tanacetum cinerariifolium]